MVRAQAGNEPAPKCMAVAAISGNSAWGSLAPSTRVVEAAMVAAVTVVVAATVGATQRAMDPARPGAAPALRCTVVDINGSNA